MEVKNKELKKLYDSVTLYFDSWCLPSLITAFMVCDDAIEGEIAAIKDELTEANQRLNNERKHSEDLADLNGQLASENADLKARLTFLEPSRIAWRARAQHAEKEVEDLNKKIHELEEELAQARNSTELHLMEENDRLREIVNTLEKEINDLKKKIRHLEIENANLRVTPPDANRIEVLKRENRALRCDNKKLAAACEENNRLREVIDGKEKEINTLKKKLEEANIYKRPWHGDANAMTGARTCSEMLAETIEFQNKKIEELEAEKARLKEAYDVQETTIKRLKLLLGKERKEKGNDTCSVEDLSYGHEFEFGDKVFVPWSDAPYMYIKTALLYNPRTESLVYVGKDQHLKWFGDKFSIV